MRRSLTVALFCLPFACAADAAADDIADIAGAVASAGHEIPAVDVLRRACDKDALCVARFLRDRIGGAAVIVPDTSEGQKPRGWARTPPLHHVANDLKGSLFIVPVRFDAAAVARAVNAAAGEGVAIRRLVLDLRQLDDAGNLDGMRRLAALFTGAQARAFRHRHIGGREVDWTIPKPAKRLGPFTLEVWTDNEIGAAAEAFGALLRLHAGARVLGETSRAGGFIMERIPVTPGWALHVPSGQVIVPGDVISDGLIPDGPLVE